MSKNIVLEIPEAEAADFEAALDQLLSELRKLDQQESAGGEGFSRLKAETRVMMEQITAALNVEKTV
jgi:hypothetical protein